MSLDREVEEKVYENIIVYKLVGYSRATSFSVEREPIGNPPIFPIVQGSVSTSYGIKGNSHGRPIDYRSTFEEAREAAKDYAFNYKKMPEPLAKAKVRILKESDARPKSKKNQPQ
ncbi:MAG: hypothetical protein AABY10_06475 [Nanoarchaeota archaeon]